MNDASMVDRLEEQITAGIVSAVRASGLLDRRDWREREPEVEVESFAVTFTIDGDLEIRFAKGDERR